MRLGTHLKVARNTRRLTQSATSLLSEVGQRQLADVESNERLPTGEELTALCRTYVIDSPTAFLWLCHEIVEKVVQHDEEPAAEVDEDLIELADRMTSFLAQRGRL